MKRNSLNYQINLYYERIVMSFDPFDERLYESYSSDLDEEDFPENEENKQFHVNRNMCVMIEALHKQMVLKMGGKTSNQAPIIVSQTVLNRANFVLNQLQKNINTYKQDNDIYELDAEHKRNMLNHE